MTDWEKAYVIQYPETFELRRDVLDAISPGRWQLSQDGTRINFDIHIDLYSYHERLSYILPGTLTTWPRMSFVASTGKQPCFWRRPFMSYSVPRVRFTGRDEN